MSQALYRKYRPQKWSEIIGQPHITKTLQNEVSSARIVHSYLFTGPRGIGKTTIARILAKSLNCAGRGDSAESCDECENCKAANSGNSLNIIEIDAASHTGVDNVRDKIIENARFLPSGAKYKVFIIDEVHMLSAAAFNALLKTLEEPPAHIIFILATTELHKLPATIISRCQRFDFKKISSKEIVGRLEKIAKVEGASVSNEVLERVAHLAEGGLRDAESLFGQLLSLGIKEIKEEDADLVLPRNDFGSALAFLEFLTEKNGKTAMLLIQNLDEKGIDFKYFFDNVIELARKLLFLKITGEVDAHLFENIKKTLSKMAQNASISEISKVLDTLLARRGDLKLLDIPSLPLELAVAELCGDPAIIASGGLRVADNVPAKTEIRQAASERNQGDISEIQGKWPEVLEKIQGFNHSLPFILKLSKPAAFDGKSLVLEIKYKLHKEKLEDPKNHSILTEVVRSVYNKEVAIIAELNTELEVEVPEDGEQPQNAEDKEVDAAAAFA